MPIPIATTTITVLRPTAASMAGEPGDTIQYQTVVSNLRANIESPRVSRPGSERRQGGSEQMTLAFYLICDTPPNIELTHLDRVRDDKTGRVYEVVWIRERIGLGLDHTVGELKRVEGLAD